MAVESTAAKTAVSLFAGAGGLDLGVEAAGFRVIFAVENNETAVETLNRNRADHFPEMPLCEPLDITMLEPARELKRLGLRPEAQGP
jgi:DNA (cytosine-5)-methyltransferase 1